MWTEEKDEMLINVIRDYPWIYDPSHELYKDVIRRKNSWKEISLSVNIDEEECRKRWTTIRDRYVKMRRTYAKVPPSGSGAADFPVIKWVLYPLVDSLLHHTTKHRTGGNSFQFGERESSSSRASTPSSVSESDSVEIHMSEDCDVVEVLAPPCQDTPIMSPPSKKGKSSNVARTSWQESFVNLIHKKQQKDISDIAGEFIVAQLRHVNDYSARSHMAVQIMNYAHEIIHKKE